MSLINVHGNMHKAVGIPNQDAAREYKSEDGTKLFLVCDGSTNIDAEDPSSILRTHSEVGSNLFVTLYQMLPEPFNVEKFPENAMAVMEKMLELVGFNKDLPEDSKEWDMVRNHYFFTILARFETENEYVVYSFGDGVIFTVNNDGAVTYINREFSRVTPEGNVVSEPPYLLYKYIWRDEPFVKEMNFRKFIFSKKDFKNVGIASDGLAPVFENSTSVYVKEQSDEISESDKRVIDKIIAGGFILFGKPDNELRRIISGNSAFKDDTVVVW